MIQEYSKKIARNFINNLQKRNLIIQRNGEVYILGYLPLVILLTALLALAPIFPDVQITRPKLLVIELGIFVLILFWLIRTVVSGSIVLRKTNLNLPIVIYAVYVFLIYVFATNKPVAISELKRMILCAGIFFIAANIVQSNKERLLVLSGWLVGFTIATIYGVLQKYGGIWIIQVPRMDRVFSTFGNPIFFAAHLVIFIPVILVMILILKNLLVKSLVSGILCISLVALYLTKTRAAWVGFAVSIVSFGILSIKYKRIRIIFIGVCSVVCLIFVFLTWNVWLRHQAHPLIWRDTLRMWLDYPLFGIGPGTFHINFPEYASQELLSIWPQRTRIINDAHNEYIQILAETGIVGFGIFAWMIYSFFKFGLKKRYHLEKTRSILMKGFSSCVIAILIQNIFSVDMRFIISSVYMFLIIGMVYSFEQERHIINFNLNLIIRDILILLLLLISGIIGFGKGMKIHVLSLFHFGIIRAELKSSDEGTGLQKGIYYTFELKPSDEGTGLLPYILKPYLAQKKLSETPDFFDERVLEPLETIAELEELVKKYPNEAKVYERLGWVYAKEKNFPKAIQNYMYAAKLDPKLFGAYNNLGNIYFHLGDRKKAIEYYRKSVEVNFDQVDAHTNLGITYYYEGILKEAADEFNIVLKLDPRNEKAIVMLKRMRE